MNRSTGKTQAGRLDLDWAARQANEDRITGQGCLSYAAFVLTYELKESDASNRAWMTYDAHIRLVAPNTSSKSRWSRGLTLGNASIRGGTAPKCDFIEPRRNDLTPENAALLMEVNEQKTLVDMWR
jgi:hypothetical protein